MQRFKDFLRFGVLQARACIFAGSFFFILTLSHFISVPGIERYDLIFIATILLQVVLIASGIETKEEAKTIFMFHLLGFALELFKTHPAIQSWSYPEPGVIKLAGVPLYSGFMYAAVGSYMMQSWNLLKMRLSGYPSYLWSIPLGALIYLNFFTHHFLPDIRVLLFFLVVITFSRTMVHFSLNDHIYKMPILVSFILIGFFIWIAENISTFLGAWVYPNQTLGWDVVSLTKIHSWILLVIISFMLVAHLKHVRKTKNLQG